MKRRSFLFSLSALALSPALVTAQSDALAAAFYGLSSARRRDAQNQLAMGGFYTGRIDGVYGPNTRAALINAEAFIEYNSYEKVRFDLASFDDARRYVDALARGALAKYLWGEGNEAAGG